MNEWTEQGYTLSSRHIVLYPDCNATKNCFGGSMLAWIDLAAAMYARDVMKTDYMVTVKMDGIVFKVPAPLGWTVSFYCKTIKEGSSSLGVNIVVTRQHFSNKQGLEEVVIDTNIVFVSVDKDTGKPLPWNNTLKHAVEGFYPTEDMLKKYAGHTCESVYLHALLEDLSNEHLAEALSNSKSFYGYVQAKMSDSVVTTKWLRGTLIEIMFKRGVIDHHQVTDLRQSSGL